MDRWAIIVDGVIVNVVSPKPEYTEPNETLFELKDGDTRWVGDNVTVFPPLSPVQFRLTMLSAGITGAAVDAAISSIPDPIAREGARIQWEYSTEYHREHPLVDQLATIVGLNSAQIDALWRAGSAL